MAEKDWILENIRQILRDTGIKEEYLAGHLGISQGELSKILSGQRKDYPKYLPQIAESLKVSFHRLVLPPGVVQNNFGPIAAHGIGQVSNLFQENKELCEQLLKAKDEIIQAERDAKEELRKRLDEHRGG